MENTVSTTKQQTQAPVNTFEDFEAIREYNFEPKADLVGVTFGIVKLRFEQAEYGIYVIVTAVDELGESHVFKDSSAGVKLQLDNWLAKKEIAATLDEDIDVKILCKKGLQPSEYTREDGKAGRTYYLA